MVRVDHHDKKIGYRFMFPGFRKPLGDFSLSREEAAFAFPPFGLIALGSLQVQSISICAQPEICPLDAHPCLLAISVRPAFINKFVSGWLAK